MAPSISCCGGEACSIIQSRPEALQQFVTVLAGSGDRHCPGAYADVPTRPEAPKPAELLQNIQSAIKRNVLDRNSPALSNPR
jgi:hypothetical protein